ncbi:7-cyano-7-deazaguanine synthase [Pseudomonas sp. JAI115]|uniref:7-cyano-7-deazaguanine synthase QueC n=1 Tax=Pseudomonas sp. JAI115 TaxID=2723061 RepID=UPI00160FF4C1|nr:7-cyano-7-deazaguanine synthase QueC [Pseudomonas sp. JAI115]MBB6155249.1 7-cyano-7-deazaguanine synthase [Pseudomonas sp. JAI115]
MKQKAVVVFSGGQGSTTCLIQALKRYDEVHCLTFDYGQRNREEIDVARHLATTLRVTAHKVLDITVLNELALSPRMPLSLPAVAIGALPGALPSTQAGRHLLFLTLAALYAYQVQARTVITGVGETDFSGQAQERDPLVDAMSQTLALGMAYPLTIQTPLRGLSKAHTWAMADAYKQLNLVRYQTLTCVNGLLGSGCGQCTACHRRAQGLEQYLANQRPLRNDFLERLNGC